MDTVSQQPHLRQCNCTVARVLGQAVGLYLWEGLHSLDLPLGIQLLLPLVLPGPAVPSGPQR